MTKSSEWLAISQDDNWIDCLSHWHFAERNTINKMIDTINLARLTGDQKYDLTIFSASEDGSRPGSVVITSQISDNIGQERLKILADTICRLIRPSRYDGGPRNRPHERTEIYQNVYKAQTASAHQRIESMYQIDRFAKALGRTQEGIEAAMDELSLWQDYPPSLLLDREVA